MYNATYKNRAPPMTTIKKCRGDPSGRPMTVIIILVKMDENGRFPKQGA